MNPVDFTPVIVEKEGVSDDSYTIVELYCNNGDQVAKGDLILCFETSKTAIDIVASTNGYIFYNISNGQSVTIGDVIAVISNTPEFSDSYFKSYKVVTPINKQPSQSINASKSALKLLVLNNIDIEEFKGVELLTESDVKTYISKNKNTKKSQLQSLKFKDTDVVIYGGGGHAKMCIEMITQSEKYTIKGVIDDNKPVGTQIFNVPVIGNENDLTEFQIKGLTKVILGIGAVLNHKSRNHLYKSIQSKLLDIPTIIHSTAMVEPSVKIGKGNQIMQGAIVGSDVTIGNNCIINSGCIISHDTVIGNNVHIAPGAIIAGGVTIQDNTVIGMGSTLFLGVSIGKNVSINNGVHIFKDIADNEIVRN